MGKNIVKKRRGVYVHTYKNDHHAELSPSGSKRWLICSGSHQLIKKLRKQRLIPPDTSGRAANEGTLAHWVNEQDKPPEHFLGQEHEVGGNRFVIDHEMNAGCNVFLDHIEDVHFFEEVKVDETEQWVDLTFLDIEGLDGGTVDRSLYTRDHRLHVIDFKYGKATVDPYTSTQIRIYAVALLERFPKAKTVVLTIVQPRTRVGSKVKEYTLSADDIRLWRDEILIPGAEAVWDEPDSFVISEMGCDYCPAKNYCPAQEQMIKLAQAPREWLSSKEKIKIWRARKVIASLLRSIESELTYDTVNGRHKNHLKVVGKNTQRRIIEPNVIRFFGKKAYTQKLKGVGEIEKLLKETNKQPDYPLFEKPEGEPELAVIEDKRQPLAQVEFINDKD